MLKVVYNKRIGKNTSNSIKFVGMIPKTYEKAIKGYAFSMDHSSNCKLQFPKDDKHCLGLVQPYLVLQIFIPKAKSFSLELLISDSSKACLCLFLDETKNDFYY